MKFIYCLLTISLLFLSSCGVSKSSAPLPNAETISFSLTNDSGESIPLLIPGVMNPSLSPFSRSGVSLKVGQNVLFRYKGKSRILLVVDSSIQDNAVIEVSQLLEQKKMELDKEG